MKKLSLSLVATLAVALVAAGGAFAKSHHAKAHHATRHQAKGLALHLKPRSRAWFRLLRAFPLDPKPLGHREAAHRPAAHTHVHRQQAKPQPLGYGPGTTLSIYEQTTKPWFLTAQGCNAARRRDSGVVVLDFGKPAFEHHSYGTILFSGRFASNHRITTSMVAWARGYVHCLPQDSTAFAILARGTSNYHPAVPWARQAGRRWALATVKLAEILELKGLADHVSSAAADDAEPAWDPRFRQTRRFIQGFRQNAQAHTLYDYGSLDGGVGAVWSAKQAFYVAGGIRHTAALPEIYNHAMADEWAQLESIAKNRFHSHVHFAGVMTQGSPSCGCSLGPHAAHKALQRALAAVGATSTVVPNSATNIIG